MQMRWTANDMDNAHVGKALYVLWPTDVAWAHLLPSAHRARNRALARLPNSRTLCH